MEECRANASSGFDEHKSRLFQRGKGHFRGLQHSEDSDSPLLSSPPPSSAPKARLVELLSSPHRHFYRLKWLVPRQVSSISCSLWSSTASLTPYLVVNSKPLASRPEVRWQRPSIHPPPFRGSYSFFLSGKAPRKQLATKAARKTAAAVRCSRHHLASKH